MRDQRTNSGVPGRPTSKRCSACRVIRPTDEFYADRRGRLTGRCRDCHRQQTRANNRRRHAALRLLITAHMEEYRAPPRRPAPGTRTDSSSIAGGERMQHDAWPPLPPGGHRPADAPPFTSPGDQLLAVGLGATAGAERWCGPAPAGLAFGAPGSTPPATSPTSSGSCPSTGATRPGLAGRGARPLPGPAGMYATFTGLVGGLSGGTAAVLRHLPGRAVGHRPSHARPAKHAGAVWAGGRELRLLTVGEPSRAG